MKTLGIRPPQYGDWDIERRFDEDPKKDRNRNSFEIDKGRIIHSASFRRLQGKTQVLGAGERDFYRTRLTHSLEVAQIGRGICNEAKNKTGFKPDSDLVDAICLAHDIGHPAFGHAGEKKLHALMLKHGGFGANPQNLRLVTFLEQKHRGGKSDGKNYDGGGLNLSRAALDGLIKYSDPFDSCKFEKSSKFTYKADEPLIEWVKGPRRRTSLECQIADWADAVVYSVDDIEDSFRAGILDFEQMKQWAPRISTEVKKQLDKNRIPDDHATTAPASIRDEAEGLERIARIFTFRERKRELKSWTSRTISRLLSQCEINIKDSKEACVRYKYELKVPPSAQCLAQVLKTTAAMLVFDDPRVKTLEAKGARILGELFEAFTKDRKLLPLDFQEYIDEKLDVEERIVSDFVAGMTDRYAYAYYGRLFEPGTGSFYEDV